MLNYESFAVRIREDEIPNLIKILRVIMFGFTHLYMNAYLLLFNVEVDFLLVLVSSRDSMTQKKHSSWQMYRKFGKGFCTVIMCCLKLRDKKLLSVALRIGQLNSYNWLKMMSSPHLYRYAFSLC